MPEIKAVIGEYADFYHESDFLPPPPGWVEVRSHAPGITRAWVPPMKEETMQREQVQNPAYDHGVQQTPPEPEVPGIMRDLPLPAKVVPDADALARKGYTGDNAPWRK